MRRSLFIGVLACILVCSAVSTAHAWSFDVHRYITGRAISLLAREIRPFFEKHRAMIVEHSIDPDLWRTVGFSEETPRHFLDLDIYGRYPFRELPRDYAQAIRKFGPEKIEANGTLPWRTDEIYARLVHAFADHRKETTPYSAETIKLFGAVLSHYIADAHVPFHAIANFDGQLSNQRGVHERFEGALFHRYRNELDVAPERRPPNRQPRDLVFDALIESARVAPVVLKADAVAIGSGEVYDDRYYDTFFSDVQPILEERIAAAIAAVAAAITGAWEEGGRPALSTKE